MSGCGVRGRSVCVMCPRCELVEASAFIRECGKGVVVYEFVAVTIHTCGSYG